MNFVRYEKSVQKLLKLPNKRDSKPNKKTGKVTKKPTFYKGVYIFSKDEVSDVHKIGMAWGAGGMFQRLKGYKLCYPFENEFWVKLLIIGTTSADSKKLEKLILASKRLKKVISSETLEGKKSMEYRITSSRTVLGEEIAKVLKTNLNLWTHIIVFGANGWKVIQHSDYPLVIKLSKPSDSYDKKPMLFSDNASSKPESSTVVVKKPKKVKVVKPKKPKKPKEKTYFSQHDLQKALALSLKQ